MRLLLRLRTPDSLGLFNLYRSGKRKFFCIDWEKSGADLEICGVNSDPVSYQVFEWIIAPCNYVHAEITATDDFVAKECIADLQQ